MMSFCKNSVNSFLGLRENESVIGLSFPHHHHRNISTAPAGGGLNLFTASIDTAKTTNVLESAAVKLPPPPRSAKRDPGGIGFVDEIGGSVDGLMSCTESLGFESSDERSMNDPFEDLFETSRRSASSMDMASTSNSRSKRTFERRVKRFPPPLSSLNQDGKPIFFLRPVRANGRLELTEVMIGRPETLLASRQDGRLRLLLIPDLIDNEEDEGEEGFSDEHEHEEEDEVIEENEKVKEWRIPVTSGGGGDGFRRCYELVNHHHRRGHGHSHHHHLDMYVWRQHCVTTG